MAKERSHKWKKGASWHCLACGQPVLHQPIQDAEEVCPECHEGAQHCEEWSDAIAAKNGTKAGQ